MTPAGIWARSRLRGAVRAVGERRAALIGGIVLAVFAALALLGPWLTGHDVGAQVGPVYGRPDLTHPLGLDDGGADVLKQIVAGSRVSMLVAVLATLVATSVGALIGIAAGYAGGPVDRLLMWLTDYFILVPALPLMIVVAEVWGPALSHTVVIIGILLWTPTARVTRAQVQTLRTRAFVQRARAMGAGHTRVIRHHILPQTRALLVANAVLTIAAAVFAEAALAFLGLEDPATVSWGALIQHASARGAVSAGAWWAIVPPGVCIALVVLAANLVSLTVEDAGHARLAAPHMSRHPIEVIHP
jgi:peptide/nickel transport system permease protein